MGKSVKATQTEHTPMYAPIHALSAEIRASTSVDNKVEPNDSGSEDCVTEEDEDEEGGEAGVVCSNVLATNDIRLGALK